MKCPNCEERIEFNEINIEPNTEEDGIKVNFECLKCGAEHYAVLRPADFEPVDWR